MHSSMSTPSVGRMRLVQLDIIAAEAEAAGQWWLTDDEASRLQAMSVPARRRSFLAGHWLARRIAADWLQVEMTRIALQRHDDGRPCLLVDGAPSPLSLSLSHSGGWLAVALATMPVGIDVEVPRRQRDLDALARFAFSPEEAERLQRMPEAQRAAAFHTLWTLKEARGKRSGEGLLPARARRVTALPSDASAAEAMSWSFQDGALALAIDAGTEIGIEGGEMLGRPLFWRYAMDD